MKVWGSHGIWYSFIDKSFQKVDIKLTQQIHCLGIGYLQRWISYPSTFHPQYLGNVTPCLSQQVTQWLWCVAFFSGVFKVSLWKHDRAVSITSCQKKTVRWVNRAKEVVSNATCVLVTPLIWLFWLVVCYNCNRNPFRMTWPWMMESKEVYDQKI